jgi:putative addiction module component (TIGR02574 family)
MTISDLTKAALALPLAHRTVLSEYLWGSIHGAPPAPIYLPAVKSVSPDAEAFCASHGVVEQKSPQDLEQLAIIAENAVTLTFDERFTLAQDAWQSIHTFAETWPIDDETLAEIERREAEIESGEVECVSHEEVMDAVRAALHKE